MTRIASLLLSMACATTCATACATDEAPINDGSKSDEGCSSCLPEIVDVTLTVGLVYWDDENHELYDPFLALVENVDPFVTFEVYDKQSQEWIMLGESSYVSTEVDSIQASHGGADISSNVSWNELLVTIPSEDLLGRVRVTMWDWDPTSSNDLMGLKEGAKVFSELTLIEDGRDTVSLGRHSITLSISDATWR